MTISIHRYAILLGILACMAAGCNSNLPLDSGNYSRGRAGLMENSRNQDRSNTMFANEITQARQLERSGQVVEALQRYVRLGEVQPNNALVWHRMAVAYDKVGRQEFAATCYEHALALDPTNAELLCDCGYGRFLRGDMASAEQLCRRALKIDPNMQRAHNNLGLVLAKSGNSTGAIEQFQLAGCDLNQARQNFQLARQSPTIERHSVPMPMAQAVEPMVQAVEPMAQAVEPMAQAVEPMAQAVEPMGKAVEVPQANPMQPVTITRPAAMPLPISTMTPRIVQSQSMTAFSSQQSKPKPMTDHAVAKSFGDQPDSSANVSQLNYYGSDPSAPIVESAATEIGSAVAKPAIVETPPKGFSLPLQATRTETDDEAGGVKMTLSSAEEVAQPTIKRSQEPKTGVVQRLGDVE